MASTGNAFERYDALSKVNEAENCMSGVCSYVNRLLDKLYGLSTVIKSKEGTPMCKTYISFGNAFNVFGKQIVTVFPDMHQSIVGLINSATGTDEDVRLNARDYEQIKECSIYTSTDRTGIENFDDAFNKIDALISEISSINSNLENAIQSYKALWHIANEGGNNTFCETVNSLANRIRNLTEDINNASQNFKNSLKSYITQVKQTQDITDQLIKAKIQAINERLETIDIAVSKESDPIKK